MKNPFRKSEPDAGSGDLKQYNYDLRPVNRNVVMRLAGSDAAQEEIERCITAEPLEAFVGKRSLEDERTDAPLAVRFFVDSRMTGVVGYAPRGLEHVVIEAVTRLELGGRKTRIPARIVNTRAGLRVELLMGRTR